HGRRPRRGLSKGGRLAAATLSGDLGELSLRTAHPVDRALSIAEKRLPMDPLRIGDPLLVGLGVAAGCRLLLDDGPLGAGQAAVDLAKLGLVLGLDAEMRDPGSLAAMRADREIDPRVVEHPLGV